MIFVGKKLLGMDCSMEDVEKGMKEVYEILGTSQKENSTNSSAFSPRNSPEECDYDCEYEHDMSLYEPVEEELHKYIYLDKNIFHSGIVNRLRKKENGDYLTVVFLHMLAQQSFRGGFWHIEDAEESLPDQIAWDIGENPEAVRKVWSYLVKWKKIDRNDRGRYEIIEYY